MGEGVDPAADLLPGEAKLATFRDGQITLTDRRIVATGPRMHRVLDLPAIMTVGIVRDWAFRARWLFIALAIMFAIVLLAFYFFLATGEPSILIFAFVLPPIVVIPVLLLLWLGRERSAFEFHAPNAQVKVPIPRSAMSEAISFLNAVERARGGATAKEDSIERGPATGSSQ